MSFSLFLLYRTIFIEKIFWQRCPRPLPPPLPTSLSMIPLCSRYCEDYIMTSVLFPSLTGSCCYSTLKSFQRVHLPFARHHCFQMIENLNWFLLFRGLILMEFMIWLTKMFSCDKAEDHSLMTSHKEEEEMMPGQKAQLINIWWKDMGV